MQIETEYEMSVQQIEFGNRVVCDLCNAEWTGKPESGGFLFGSKAVCPTCAPSFEKQVKQCGEEHYIRARCVPGMSFYDWVTRILRGGAPAVIRVLTGQDAEAQFDETMGD